MNAKRQRDKNRRRAARLAEQAWEAADDDNYDLAVNNIGRAVELNPGNPVLWNDQGVLLQRCNNEELAARSFQAAIQMAPDYADAYAGLAAIRARQGKAAEAVTLQRQAARHAPNSDRQKDALAAYEALLVGGCDTASTAAVQPHAGDGRLEVAPSTNFPDLAARIDGLNWPQLDARLTARGLAHIPALLRGEECEGLRSMFNDDRLFAKTVTMNKNRFGKGVYRYFAAPVPALVDALRGLVYPHVAQIANRWQGLLNEVDLYPATWPAFQGRCAKAGQTTPSPLLLRYEAGGFNTPHQDIRGEVFFPLQLVVVLSPRADSAVHDPSEFTGGEFLFCDQPERHGSDRCAMPAGLGDAILFCTRARLVQVGNIYGLKPVKHGLNRITAGTRYALGIPFHEFE